MKQFTDYHSTPLKFHKFFHYVWTPFFLLAGLYAMFGFAASYSPYNVISAVQLTYSVLNTGLIVAYFIGFFHWKLYGWYCLFGQMAAEIVYSAAILILYIIFVPQTFGYLIGNLVGVVVRSTLIGIYYYKRRPLFTKDGFNPKEKSSTTVQTVSAVYTSAGKVVCPHCKNEISADNAFCIFCGNAVDAPKKADHILTENRTASANPLENTDVSTSVYDGEKNAEIATNAISIPVANGKNRSKLFIPFIAACVCAVVMAALNVVQYSQVKEYKAAATDLSLQVNTLNETIDGYRTRVNEIIENNKATETDAQLYGILAKFMTEEMPEFRSKTYYSSDYVLFIPFSSYKRTFTVTANLPDVTVSFYPVGESVTADFVDDWKGNSIDIYLIPEKKGLTTLHFSNDKNGDTFKVMIFVV